MESVQGVGSCFNITLPFSVVSKHDSGKVRTTDATEFPTGEPRRILVAEDNRINSYFLVSLLRKMGHDAVVVENGRDCIDALGQSPFDLVLMDIHMPIMNGEEALREIRRKEQGTRRRQRVIALTAFSLRGEKDRFIQAGFDGYVSKPIDITLLLQEITRVLSCQ